MRITCFLLVPIALIMTSCQSETVPVSSDQDGQEKYEAFVQGLSKNPATGAYDVTGDMKGYLLKKIKGARYHAEMLSVLRDLSPLDWHVAKAYITSHSRPVDMPADVFKNQQLLHTYQFLNLLFKHPDISQVIDEVRWSLDFIFNTGEPIEWDTIAYGIRLLQRYSDQPVQAYIDRILPQIQLDLKEYPEGTTWHNTAKYAFELLSANR